MPLLDEISALPADLKKTLSDRGFDHELFAKLAELHSKSDGNRVEGTVERVVPSDLETLATPGTPKHAEWTRAGERYFREGKVALVVMAGGMATRMGGVVKVLVDVFDDTSFLDLRIAENAAFERKFGKKMPLWLMTSAPTEAPIRDALKKANAPAHITTFEQGLGLRLDERGSIFKESNGVASTCATGHGDLVDALRRSLFLKKFVEDGGEYVFISNVDNLGATPDPAILGALLESKKRVLVEVVKKEAGDRGGIPVRWNGKAQILEEFRLPETFDPNTVDVFNTNTFLVEAKALLEAEIDWTWFKVTKKVEGKNVVQFERLVQEIAAVLPSMFLVVPRDGDDPRFLPVKDNDELARRRETLETLATKRGWIPGRAP